MPGCPKCPGETVLASREPESYRCRRCNSRFEVCGNCDVPGLIPLGMTSDDCSVCNGTTLVETRRCE